MTDYKATLNLPATSFAMKANLAQREPEMLKRWQQEGIYQQIRAARTGCPHLFCTMALPTLMAIFILATRSIKFLKTS